MIQIFICLSLIIAFIIFPGLAHRGAMEGTLLFFESLFPYLFPYLIVSNWLLALTRQIQTAKWLQLLKVYVLGSIGGFPTGTLIVSQLYGERQLTKRSAEILLAICHSPNPLFVIGFVGNELLNLPFFGYMYFISLHMILLFFLFLYRQKIEFVAVNQQQAQPINFFQLIQHSIQTTFVIGGVIIFFSTLLTISLAFFQQLLPVPLLLLLSSGIEMTNGLVYLNEWQPPLLLTLCAVALTTQSVSIHLQVFLFAKKEGLSLNHYVRMRIYTATIIGLLFFMYEQFGLL